MVDPFDCQSYFFVFPYVFIKLIIFSPTTSYIYTYRLHYHTRSPLNPLSPCTASSPHVPGSHLIGSVISQTTALSTLRLRSRYGVCNSIAHMVSFLRIRSLLRHMAPIHPIPPITIFYFFPALRQTGCMYALQKTQGTCSISCFTTVYAYM